MQTFRDFMESALYDPERGYYNRRTPTEDFYTAPELHPAFAGVLAREIVKRLEALKAQEVPGPYAIVEMGSGTGRLAREILCSIRREHPGWESARYVLVERCRTTLLESVVSLSTADPVLGYSRLEEMLPCAGVFLSNELVDAFPVHLLEKRDGRVREVYVEESGQALLSDLSTPELAAHAEAVAESLAEGERHAVNLEALRWLAAVAGKIKDGYLITIDYGKRFGAAANPPRAFFKHADDHNLTQDKGRKDITASVDFDALIEGGRRHGLELEAYTSLSQFLLDGGIVDWLAAESPAGDVETFKSRTKIKTLLHPEGMGEAFKVLVQRKRSAS